MAELPATLVGLQRALAGGQVSVREALRIQRQRVPVIDARTHCVVSVPDELDDADSPEAPHGPLSGIGLAHKDIFDTRGHRPGAGHDAGGPAPGLVEAPALARLRARGAAHLARLAMAEYACGATAANSRQRPCINPLRPQAVVGGSSSGSAVAVASGLAYGALGTDTAGSVRIPAATCGVLGLKTTHGLVSNQGTVPLARSLDSVGLLARSATDAMQLLAAIAQRPLPPPVGVAGLRVKAWLPDALDPAVGAALLQFLAHWPRARIVADLPEQPRLAAAADVLLHAEAAQVHRAALLGRTASPAVEAVALPGLAIADGWAAAVRTQRAASLRAFITAHLSDHDLLVLPALAHPVPDWDQVTPGAPGFDARQLVGLYRHMGFVNHLGLPALVMPVAADARGMPISVQVLARPFGDADLLAWAAWAEQRLPVGPALGLALPSIHATTV